MRYGLDCSGDDPYSDRTGFPAQSSVLDEEAFLPRVVKEYRIPRASTCRFFSRGDSDIYCVRAGGKRFYLKVYRPPIARAQVEAEARFVTGLSSCGVAVVLAVKRRDGDYASEVMATEGPRPMLLFEEAPPRPFLLLEVANAHALGVAIGQLHDAADSLGMGYDLRTVNCNWALNYMLPFAEAHMPPEDYAYLEDLGARIRPRLEELPTEPPDFGLCHSDLVLCNIRQSHDGGVTFFDFGSAAFSWRANELGLVQQVLHHPESRGRHEEMWDAFAGGYADVRALPAGVDELLPVLMLLRRIMGLSGALASCPLRMGTANFSEDFVNGGLAGIRELASGITDL